MSHVSVVLLQLVDDWKTKYAKNWKVLLIFVKYYCHECIITSSASRLKDRERKRERKREKEREGGIET